MACILEGVLQCDVFLGEFAVEIGSVGVFGGDWRGRMRGDGRLLRWRTVVGVLEDSFGSLGRRAGGRVYTRRFF